MSIFNISLKVLNILLTLLMLSGCGVVKLSGFRSDEDMIGIFKKNKAEITTVMKKCKAFNNPVGAKDRTRESFNSCKIDPVTLKRIQTQEVYQGYAEHMIGSKFFNGSPILFKMEEVELLGVDVFIEEKGYVFSETPIKDKLIEKGSLDRLIGTELFKKQGLKEEWIFRQIEPNWYIYYRQYHAGFQG